MSENNNKGSVLVLIGLVIVTTVNILDKLSEENKYESFKCSECDSYSKYIWLLQKM